MKLSGMDFFFMGLFVGLVICWFVWLVLVTPWIKAFRQEAAKMADELERMRRLLKGDL